MICLFRVWNQYEFSCEHIKFAINTSITSKIMVHRKIWKQSKRKRMNTNRRKRRIGGGGARGREREEIVSFS